MENRESLHLKIHANCIPVKGDRRSIICDFQRNSFHYIPNDLYNFIKDFDGESLANIYQNYQKENLKIIEEYVKFLIDQEFAIFTENPDSFPELNLEWDEPSLITNAIIDSSSQSNHDWEKIIEGLERVGCRDVQLRFYENLTKKDLIQILNQFENKRIKSIEMIVKYNDTFSDKYFEELTLKYLRIKTIYIHSSPEDRIGNISSPSFLLDGMGNYLYVKQEISSSDHCGMISKFNFSIHLKTFTEGLNFNSCLNRKIGIDIDGSIKNCPSLLKSYGNYRTDNMIKIATREDFQESWHIAKDDINICKDCEHRYICTDCRAFTSNGNKFDKPLNCNYDPYSAKWRS